MKVIKPQSLGVLFKPYSFMGRHYLSVAAIGFFGLGTETERFLPESKQWAHVVASLPAGQPLDEAMSKQGAEALLLGSAYAPNRQACTSLTVQLQIDDSAGQPSISKCLCVCGEREWRAKALRTRRVSRPKPFLQMPLTYSRAFGGPRNPANPIGCGSRGSRLGKGRGAMPNVSYAPHAVDTAWRSRVAAGFGPIPVGHAARQPKFGSYGRTWRKHDAPGFARDIDWSVFNMAPPDQWADAPFKGGERYVLRNLHPQHAELAGSLPRFAARAFVLDEGKTPEQAREVPLQMDTVWFVPDHDLGIVIYHGKAEIQDSDGLDVGVLMVGYEHNGEPKSEAHYHEVMALRLDAETGRLHVFNDSQLAPQRSAAGEARRQQAQQAAEEAALARSQRRLDLLDAQYWAKRGTPPPADHQVARAKLPPLGLMTSQTAVEGDFDLTDIVTKAKALADEAERRGKEALAKLPKAVSVAVDAAKLLATALEHAAVPAYDLLPPDQTGRDPQIEAMRSQLPKPASDADAKALAQYEKSCAAVMKIPSLKRQARRAAPKVTLPALPYPADVAESLGMQIRQWREAGVSLAGRDLAGADLPGVDFSGADLREVMLDGANLTGAKFVGADLRGAVFVGARLDRADFSGANLEKANLCESEGCAISFEGANLSYVQALGAQWPQANLRRTRLHRLLGIRLALPAAALDDADASKATLFDLNADDSSWRAARLEKTVLLRASLQRGDFGRAMLKKTVFNTSDLQSSRWDHARLDSVQGGGKTTWRDAALAGAAATNCGFHGADLSHADLSDAQFLRCDFGQCDMSDATLTGSAFSRCGLYRSSLRSIDAGTAEFFHCLCRKTDFTGARLSDAAFVQCELTGSIPVEGQSAQARGPA
ncbi:DUF2169 family type VI secretion system accessory protein [Trinickia dinghuensis]|uniref:DUF2169 domain-containing protein n=1 Tax=Trinickia dinghuensis TaxID=2291023 RepID=A0A3D8JPV1_9BURK|nr:DUF2169 domain-containing protein [Trinickia dinghuensis]RDU94735.1 DUF2169 domain-containing protein [Trinickia dinghuensis]